MVDQIQVKCVFKHNFSTRPTQKLPEKDSESGRDVVSCRWHQKTRKHILMATTHIGGTLLMGDYLWVVPGSILHPSFLLDVPFHGYDEQQPPEFGGHFDRTWYLPKHELHDTPRKSPARHTALCSTGQFYSCRSR